ncbi:hypothetical protein SAFG77S_13472 [Streptomyces afghaniensis]
MIQWERRRRFVSGGERSPSSCDVVRRVLDAAQRVAATVPGLPFCGQPARPRSKMACASTPVGGVQDGFRECESGGSFGRGARHRAGPTGYCARAECALCADGGECVRGEPGEVPRVRHRGRPVAQLPSGSAEHRTIRRRRQARRPAGPHRRRQWRARALADQPTHVGPREWGCLRSAGGMLPAGSLPPGSALW